MTIDTMETWGKLRQNKFTMVAVCIMSIRDFWSFFIGPMTACYIYIDTLKNPEPMILSTIINIMYKAQFKAATSLNIKYKKNL